MAAAYTACGRKHMVLLGHNVRLCRPLRRPRCAVSPLIHTLMGHITAWLCVHTHCCLVMCAHTLLLGYVHTHRVGHPQLPPRGPQASTRPCPCRASPMCRSRRFLTHLYRMRGSQAGEAERGLTPRPPRAGCSPSYSTALRVRGRVQPRPRLNLARFLVRRTVAGIRQTRVFATAAAEIVAAAPEAARLWAVRTPLAAWEGSV